MQRTSQKPHSVVARTQALQAALVHGAPELMFVLDAGGAVEFANRADLPPEVAQLLEASASTQRSKEGDILLDAIARIATTGHAQTLEVGVNAGTE